MIELKSVTKIYRNIGQEPLKALDDVSLTLPQTGMVFILGPSGCGKSTLLNILGGLDTYTSGELLIGGNTTKNYSAKDWDKYRNKTIGFIFQDYGLIDDYTVHQNVELALELQHVTKKQSLVKITLENLGLSTDKKRKPSQLSGGQKQRVAIARAIIKSPSIILADEPTGNLDTKTSKQILDILREYAKDHLVIIVSHSKRFAEAYADQIFMMEDGKIKDFVEQIEEIEPMEKSGIVEDENNMAKAKKYKSKPKDLSIKKVFEYAWRNTFLNMARYLVVIFLFVTMSILAGVCIIASKYDRYKTAYNTIINSGITNIEISSEEKFVTTANGTELIYDDCGNWNVAENITIDEEEIEEIEGLGGSIYKIYSFRNTQDYRYRELWRRNNNLTASYCMTIDDKGINNLGYKLVVGRLPQNNSEVMLTAKDADEYISSYELQEFAYPAVLGKSLFYLAQSLYDYSDTKAGWQRKIVVGIVDTGYDKAIAEAAKSIKKDSDYDTNLELYKNEENNKCKHHTVFVSNDFINNYYTIVGTYEYYRTKTLYQDIDTQLTYIEERENTVKIQTFETQGGITSLPYLEQVAQSNGCHVEYFSPYGDITELGENEVILYIRRSGLMYYWSQYEPELINNFTLSAYSTDREAFDDAVERIFACMLEENFTVEFDIRQNCSNGEEEALENYSPESFKVVGFYLILDENNEVNTTVSNCAACNFSKLMECEKDEFLGVTEIVFDVKNSSLESVSTLLKYLEDSDDYSFNHLYAEDLNIAGIRAEMLKGIGMEAAIILGVSAILVMSSMVFSMINKNSRQLGIFRALGATRSKVMLIYVLQGLMLFILSFCLSSMLLPIVADYVQGASGLSFLSPIFKDAADLESMSSNYSVKLIDVLGVEIEDYVYIGVFGFVVIMVATAVPTFIKLHKNPIQLLRRKDG